MVTLTEFSMRRPRTVVAIYLLLIAVFAVGLSRLQTEEDLRVCAEFLERNPNRRLAWEDLHWALINTREFLFRH